MPIRNAVRIGSGRQIGWPEGFMSSVEQFAEKTTSFIRSLSENSTALRQIYFIDPARETIPMAPDSDVMLEKRMTVSKGLICKYSRRALLLLSYTCAAHCRYCERQDRVGAGLDAEGRLTDTDIRNAVEYLRTRSDVSEVIFSGGDPLTNMPGLSVACRELAKLSHIRTLRIHTRFPMQHPEAVQLDVLSTLVDSVPAFYFSLHIDHPDELTERTESVIHRLRKMGYLLLSQTVFLRGINDEVSVLDALFSRLSELGVRPYYIYHCMPVPTTMRFVMPLKHEVEIMSELRKRLSGHSLPTHILEMPGTTGKIAVPTNYWEFDPTSATDFFGNEFVLDEMGMIKGEANQ